MEAILYQFINLYERWSEDRQVAAKQGAEIARLSKELAAQIARFETLTSDVRNDIKKSIREEAENTAVYFAKTLRDAAHQQIEPLVEKLTETVNAAEHQLVSYRSDATFANVKIIVISLLMTVCTSLMMVKLLMPTPTVPLTDEQIRIYGMGKHFSELWPTLSKEKQQWFLQRENSKGVA